MITNELIFLLHTLLISTAAIIALRLNKEALVALLCIQALLSNLFVTKQMLFLGFCVTCSDVFSIGSSLCLNLLQEYFGSKIAFRTIWISFFCLIFYVTMSWFQLLYIPSSTDTMHNIFATLLTPMPRIIAASLFSYVITQHIDAFLYGYLQKRWHNKHFIIKNYSSLLVSQLIDTILFSMLGLWGLVERLDHIIIISYGIKVIAIALAVPFVTLCKQFIPKPT